jgi:short-subunit dehydrogenase involved in D-alanine esterification of teichoic acids
MEVTIDPRILNKVLLICQKNSTKLDQISKRQDKMETIMVEQNDKIDQILSKIEVQNNADNKVVKNKGKKTKNEFYQVNICFIINFFLFILSLF